MPFLIILTFIALAVTIHKFVLMRAVESYDYCCDTDRFRGHDDVIRKTLGL